jgi:hypothetical protein
MPKKEINSARDLVKELIRIFPTFLQEWDEGRSFGYDGDYKLHTVFLTFGPKSLELLEKGKPKQLEEFCALVNFLVEKGGDFENAVSTCFLEHATQLGVRDLIKPFLSPEAEREIR